MAIEINGVVLPDLPADVLETHPYYVVLINDVVNIFAICFTSEAIWLPKTVTGATFNIMGCIDNTVPVELLLSGSSWGKGENLQPGVPIAETISAIWANHDIKIVTGMNDDGTPIFDGIYFPNSETPSEPDVPEEPEYGKIRRQHMRDIGDAIRRKTGKKDKIPTPLLASEIDSIVTADNALVLKENERIYQVGNAESNLQLSLESTAVKGTV